MSIILLKEIFLLHKQEMVKASTGMQKSRIYRTLPSPSLTKTFVNRQYLFNCLVALTRQGSLRPAVLRLSGATLSMSRLWLIRLSLAGSVDKLSPTNR